MLKHKLKYSDYKNIPLNSFENFFSSYSLELLVNNQIVTLGDLLNKYESKKLFKLFPDNPTRVDLRLKNEICGTTKLLRYKYLDEALDINLQSDSIDIETDFGFSCRALCFFDRSAKIFTISDLFCMAEEKDFSELFSIRGIDMLSVREIENKVMIVYECYNRMKDGLIHFNCEGKSPSKAISILSSELQNLSLELKKVMERESQLIEQIDEVQERIRQKTLELTK